MSINKIYRGTGDMPPAIPVFPLEGALLLPRGQLPLNIFEPRYLEMVDDALRDGHRMIGMIQPDPAHPPTPSGPALYSVGCAGRITQFAETGDGRYLMQLTGIARFHVEEELKAITGYRQCRVSFVPFADDFIARKGEADVNRDALMRFGQAAGLFKEAGLEVELHPGTVPEAALRDRHRELLLREARAGRRDPCGECCQDRLHHLHSSLSGQ